MISIDLSRVSTIALAAAMGGMGFAVPAAATPTQTTSQVIFNFNDNNTAQGSYSAAAMSCACGTNPNNLSIIQNYMTNVLKAAGFGTSTVVTVTGAVGQLGAPSGNNVGSYTGDGHVVGSSSTRPRTLADTEGATPTSNGATEDSGSPLNGSNALGASHDGYIKNCTVTDGSNCSPQTSAFQVQIGTQVGSNVYKYLLDTSGKKYEIDSLSFDFEIFPDGTCTDDSISACGGSDGHGGFNNMPDLTAYAIDKNGVYSQLGTWDGIAPTTSSTYKVSYNMNPETAPQRLDVSGPLPVSASGVLGMEIADWPATVGIDNLVLNFRTPESGSLAMFALGLLGLAGIARRRRRARPT